VQIHVEARSPARRFVVEPLRADDRDARADDVDAARAQLVEVGFDRPDERVVGVEALPFGAPALLDRIRPRRARRPQRVTRPEPVLVDPYGKWLAGHLRSAPYGHLVANEMAERVSRPRCPCLPR